jgi:hypothetical protein
MNIKEMSTKNLFTGLQSSSKIFQLTNTLENKFFFCSQQKLILLKRYNKKMKSLKFILAFIIFSLHPTKSYPQSALEIVRKSQDLLYAKSSYVEMTMRIIKPDWERKLGMKVWALEPDYAMIYITEPARDKDFS